MQNYFLEKVKIKKKNIINKSYSISESGQVIDQQASAAPISNLLQYILCINIIYNAIKINNNIHYIN